MLGESAVADVSVTEAEVKKLLIFLRNCSRLPDFEVRLILVHTCEVRCTSVVGKTLKILREPSGDDRACDMAKPPAAAAIPHARRLVDFDS